LSQQEMTAAFDGIMSGTWPAEELAEFLVALRAKGETVAEIAGAAQALRKQMTPIRTARQGVLDTCGTGGDGSATFNISTAAALVAAAAGVPVAKHGNRAISSKCGSADLLMALGVNIEAPQEVVEECIRDAGIGFLFAPKMHPAMKHAMGPRKELGVRTIFNMLGPLTNPAGAKGQIIGVFSPELTEPFAQVLRLLGSRRAFVVHGHDGMDEITTTTTTRVSELSNGQVRTYEFDALDFIDAYVDGKALVGGDPATNAAITRKVLSGDKGPCRDIACLNAAAAIVAGGKAKDIREGWKLANESLDSGKAMKALEALIRISKAG
jgi:anthranilate phosphoribosyltransferase